MTFTDLNLPISTGYGLWSETAQVSNNDWAAAESALVTDALAYLETPRGKRASGYGSFRNEAAQTLRLDLLRGA